MLDHRAFLQDPDTTFAQLARRNIDAATVGHLRDLADERRRAIQRAEGLRHDLNQASAAVQERARAGDKAAVDAARDQLKTLKAEIKTVEEAQGKVEAEL